MALEMNDLMALKSLENGMSPYEQVKVGYMQSKRPSGSATAGLVLGSVGTALAIGAWIFGPIIANNRARQATEAARAAKDVANANYNGLAALVAANASNTNATLDRLINTVATERAERIAGDFTISQTQSDTQTGSQAAQLTAQQAAELSSIQSVQQNLLNNAIMGNLSENPQKVVLVSGQRECGCPATNGCGFNG